VCLPTSFGNPACFLYFFDHIRKKFLGTVILWTWKCWLLDGEAGSPSRWSKTRRTPTSSPPTYRSCQPLKSKRRVFLKTLLLTENNLRYRSVPDTTQGKGLVQLTFSTYWLSSNTLNPVNLKLYTKDEFPSRGQHFLAFCVCQCPLLWNLLSVIQFCYLILLLGVRQVFGCNHEIKVDLLECIFSRVPEMRFPTNVKVIHGVGVIAWWRGVPRSSLEWGTGWP